MTNRDQQKSRSTSYLAYPAQFALAAIILLTASILPAQQRDRIDIRGSGPDWHAEFDELCSLVDGAMEMSREDLDRLLFRCRVLERRIEELPETPRKVYGRRLRMCRDLYQFVIQHKSGSAEEGGGGATSPAEGSRNENR